MYTPISELRNIAGPIVARAITNMVSPSKSVLGSSDVSVAPALT